LVACTSLPLPLGAQGVLTLQEALREARMANAMLPVARFDTVIARARIVEARGVLWTRLSAESDLHAGTPNRYTGNDARLQVVADEDLYDGGGLRAGIQVAEAQARGTRARYRLAEKDLDFAVELRYSELLKTEEELTFRRAGIARLRTYLASVQARQAAGQGVADDVLKTQVRLSAATADLEDAARRLDLARFELNDLLGRAPDGPVELAPLPPPGPPPVDSTGEPWATAPEVRSAEADVDAALSNVTVTRAGRRPHLSFSADAGALPLFPGSEVGTGLNNGTRASTGRGSIRPGDEPTEPGRWRLPSAGRSSCSPCSFSRASIVCSIQPGGSPARSDAELLVRYRRWVGSSQATSKNPLQRGQRIRAGCPT